MAAEFTIHPDAPFTFEYTPEHATAVIEASTAGLRPGFWPGTITVGEMRYVHSAEQRSPDGELVAMIYTEPGFGRGRLAVIND